MYARLSDDAVSLRGRLTSPDTTTSPHSGKPLFSGRIEIVGPKGDVRNLQTEEPCQLAVEEGDVRRVRVAVERLTYNDRSSDAHLLASLQEVEDLTASGLRLLGMELEPEHYIEEYDDRHRAIVVRAWVTVTEAHHLTLRDARRPDYYFPVHRDGVSDTPLSMRLGRPAFTPHEDGTFRYMLVLVEEVYDEAPAERPLFFDEEAQESRRRLAELLEFTDGLVGLIVDRGFATRDEIADLRSTAKGAARLREYDFLRHPDVDELRD